jgi:hypothetical protein
VPRLPLYDDRYLLLTAGDGPYGGAGEPGWRVAADERLCLLTPDMQDRRSVDRCLRGGGHASAPGRRADLVTVPDRSAASCG